MIRNLFSYRNCVRTHVDVCFKEGKCQFPCVESSCPGEYAIQLVGELLPPNDFNRLNRRIQEENIRQGTNEKENMKRKICLFLFSWNRWSRMLSLLSLCCYCWQPRWQSLSLFESRMYEGNLQVNFHMETFIFFISYVLFAMLLDYAKNRIISRYGVMKSKKVLNSKCVNSLKNMSQKQWYVNVLGVHK